MSSWSEEWPPIDALEGKRLEKREFVGGFGCRERICCWMREQGENLRSRELLSPLDGSG